MGLFCWKNCQEKRAAKQEVRQAAKTERTALRQQAKTVGFLQGFDTSFNSNFAQPLGSIGQTAVNNLTGGTLTSAFNQLGANQGGVSGSVSFGKNQWIPIVLAVAVAGVLLFRDFLFGNGSTRKRRR